MKLTGHEILCIMKIIYRFSMGKVCSFLWACDSIKNFSQGKVIGISNDLKRGKDLGILL